MQDNPGNSLKGKTYNSVTSIPQSLITVLCKKINRGKFIAYQNNRDTDDTH